MARNLISPQICKPPSCAMDHCSTIQSVNLIDQKLLSCLDLDILVLRVYVCHEIWMQIWFWKAHIAHHSTIVSHEFHFQSGSIYFAFWPAIAIACHRISSPWAEVEKVEEVPITLIHESLVEVPQLLQDEIIREVPLPQYQEVVKVGWMGDGGKGGAIEAWGCVKIIFHDYFTVIYHNLPKVALMHFDVCWFFHDFPGGRCFKKGERSRQAPRTVFNELRLGIGWWEWKNWHASFDVFVFSWGGLHMFAFIVPWQFCQWHQHKAWKTQSRSYEECDLEIFRILEIGDVHEHISLYKQLLSGWWFFSTTELGWWSLSSSTTEVPIFQLGWHMWKPPDIIYYLLPSGFRPVFVCRRSSCHSSKPGKGSSRCPWVWSKRRMWHGLVLGQRGKDWEGAGIGVLLVGWQLVATFYWTLRMDGHLQFYCVGICGIIGITLAGLRNS